jgi:hypothetical protein
MTLAAAVLVAAIISADLPVQVVFKGNPKARPDEKCCVSWWGPNILVTNSNTTIICASCKPNARGAPTTSWVSRSTSAGRTWSAPVRATGPGCGDAVYSRTTNTILQTTAPPRSEVGEFVQGSAACSPCCEALHKYCGAFVAKGAACLRCEQQHAAALRNATACKGDPSGKMQRFCGATPPPPSPPGPRPPPTPPTPPGALPGPIWAHQLPPLTAAQLAKCETGLSRSTDEAHTWSAPTLMSINNSLGPHYGGGGLNHGIQMRRGPHAGRLVLARRLNCKAVMGDHNEQQYFHSFALFSDDNGDSWTAGQLLPKGWTECQAAELVNGSLLMTSRMYGSPWLTPGHPQASDRRRGFARSDDGTTAPSPPSPHSRRPPFVPPAPAFLTDLRALALGRRLQVDSPGRRSGTSRIGSRRSW